MSTSVTAARAREFFCGRRNPATSAAENLRTLFATERRIIFPLAIGLISERLPGVAGFWNALILEDANSSANLGKSRPSMAICRKLSTVFLPEFGIWSTWLPRMSRQEWFFYIPSGSIAGVSFIFFTVFLSCVLERVGYGGRSLRGSL